VRFPFVDRRCTGQDQVLDVRTQGISDRRLNGVNLGVQRGGFGDDVARVVHHVGVVAQPTSQGIGSDSTIQNVGSSIAVMMLLSALPVP